MASWLDDTTANRYRKSYFKDFLDLSGNLTVRNGDFDISGGNALISGNVGIGTTSPTTKLDVIDDGPVLFASSTSVHSSIKSAAGAKIILNNRTLSEQSPSTDETKSHGKIIWAGHNRSLPSASIEGKSDGWDDAGELIFATSSGSGGAVERMRIADNGSVGIGTDNPGRQVAVYHSSNPAIQLANTTTGATGGDGTVLEAYGADSFFSNRDNGNMFFRTASDQPRMTIQQNGQIGMGNSGNVFTTQNNVLSLDPVNSPGGDALGVRSANDGYNIINFYNLAGSNRGSISGVNSSSIQYNTTSDRRLKTDIVTLQDGLAKVMKLKPRSYRWKENGELADGFVAQEVFEVLPHFIPQNRFKCDISQNEVYHGKVCSCCDIETKSNGEDYIFGLDYSTFTPYLCKAIQEQQTLIETEKAKTALLETENATLKTQMADVLSRLSALESA